MEYITFEEAQTYAAALKYASKLRKNLDPEDIADEILTQFAGTGPDMDHVFDIMAMLIPVDYNYRVRYYPAAERQKSLIDGKQEAYMGRNLEWYEQERQDSLDILKGLDIFQAAPQFQQKARGLRRVMEIMAYSHFVREAAKKEINSAAASRMLADGMAPKKVASYLYMNILDVYRIARETDSQAT